MSSGGSDNLALDKIVVRFYQPRDQGALEHLYREALLAGQALEFLKKGVTALGFEWEERK